MFRKAAIVVLSVATVLALVAGIRSHVKPWPQPSLVIPFRVTEAEYDYMLKDGVFHLVYMRPGPQGTQSTKKKGFNGLYAKSMTINGSEASGIGVSIWLIAAATAFVPACAFAGGPLRRRWRRKRNRCTSCGYQLIGLTEPRCPECGVGITLPSGQADLKTCRA